MNNTEIQKKIQLSIIIPVYNDERRITQLLKSIMQSSREGFEVIVVDDGSTDTTLSVCSKYSDCDNRIRVFHRSNGGVSSARNYGLNQAKGDYVYFCDSDDIVFSDVLDKGLNFLNWMTADIVYFDYEYQFIGSGRRSHSSFVLCPNQELDKSYIIENMLKPLVLSVSTDMASLWHKFFKREIIEKHIIRFEEKVHKGEDWRFIIDFLSNAKTAYYVPEVLYAYRLDGSQQESKYGVTFGISALGSLKRKLFLNKRYNLGANNALILEWYSQIIRIIIFSIKNGCDRIEMLKMIKDESVAEATDSILRISGNRLIRLEIPRKYKLYSLLISKKMYRCFFFACNRLE